MTCEEHKEQIVLGLYGELTAGERGALDGHLASCGPCREAERAYTTTVRLVRRCSPRVPSRPRISRVWRAAAAAVLLGALTLIVAEGARGTRPGVSPRVAAPSAAVRIAAIERGGAAVLSVAEEDLLCDLAAGTDDAIALRAADLLGRRGTGRAEGALRSALRRPATRAVAYRALVALRRIDPVRGAAADLADPLLREAACEALLGRGTPEACRALLSRAAKGDVAALAACRAFRPAAALGELRAALADGAVREAAIDVLLAADGESYRTALLDEARKDAAVLDAALSRARRPLAAGFLVRALCEGLAPAQALSDVPVRRLRVALAEALRRGEARAVVLFLSGRADEAAARDLLVEALAHGDVRAEAGRTLLARGDLRAVGPLLAGGTAEDCAALDALPPDARRRELSLALATRSRRAAAVRAIGPGDASLWTKLVPLLADDSLRGEALAALARTGIERSIPFVIPYVSGSRDGREARRALVALAGEDLGDDAREWRAWWRSKTN